MTRAPGAASRGGLTGLDRWTALALLIVLVLHPAANSLAPIDRLVAPILRGEREYWWYWHGVVLGCQWIPFAFIWWALRRNGEAWSSLGLDWGWFGRHRLWLGGVGFVLFVGALLAPGIHYGSDPPAVSRTIFLAPISSIERLFMVAAALSAGVCEEVAYRAFSITRLSRVLRSPWLALPITVVAFVFIQGDPDNWGVVFNYVGAGLAFGVSFILLGLRRLEVLVAVPS